MRDVRLGPLSAALLATTSLTAAAVAQSNAPVLPQGGRFVAGQGSIGVPVANSLAVTQQSARGVIDWRSFSIGHGATVSVHNGAGATLNRVTGGDLTQILGTLRATGTLYVVNAQGVVVGRTGVVTTGGSFVASTLGLANDAFMRGGTLVFRAGDGATAEVRNLGQITAGGGDVILIARSVTNAGTIAAPRGTAALAAGSEVLLREGPDGTRGIVRVRGTSGDITNAGLVEAAQAELRAAGGNVYALAGNTGGAVRATGTEMREGRVWLSARNGEVAISGEVAARNADGAGGQVSVRAGAAATVTGTISADGTRGGAVRVRALGTTTLALGARVSARGAAAGGTVEMDSGPADRLEVAGTVDASSSAGTGGRVALLGREVTLRGAMVDASGATGGGTVRVGGGREGGEGLREAARVTVDTASTIRGDATGQRGNGGDVVLWSSSWTEFRGLITARGGAVAGDGGEAEVSSRGRLAYDGTTDLRAAAGQTGTLLLDPYNIVISNAAQTADGSFVATGNDSVVNATTLSNALATANVTVSTGLGGSAGGQAGDVTVAAPVTWASNTLLTLTAANAIAINAPITVTGGGQLALNHSTASLANLSFSATATVGGTGRVEFQPNAAQASQALTINGSAYTLLRSMADVAGMSGTGRSALAAPMTAAASNSDAVVTASGGGSTFAGTFTGLGNTITGLTVSTSGSGSYGLFGAVGPGGVVRDIGLVGGSVTGGDNAFVGGLVGWNTGTVASSFSSGPATVGLRALAGGLVGLNDGTVWSSFATGATSGGAFAPVGGLVGTNRGIVSSSFATGAASGGQSAIVGGLVGYNTGTVSSSFATSASSGGFSTTVGGLVGYNAGGTVSSSFASGVTSGGSGAVVGGLVGFNESGAVASSFSTGAVSGGSVGGLVGVNDGGTVSSSFWDIQTSGLASSAGGGTGLTTRQLQGLDVMPGGTSLLGTLNATQAGAFAGGVGGLYPYVTSIFPGGVQAVTGTVYSDAGATARSAAPVGVASGAIGLLAVTSGANGYYYAFGAAGTLPPGSNVVAWTGGSSAALATTGSAPATLTVGVDLWGNTLRAFTASLAWSGAFGSRTPRQAALAATSLAGAQTAISGTASTRVDATGASFTLDTALTVAAPLIVATGTAAALTVSAPVTVNGTSLGLLSGSALSIDAPVRANGQNAAVTLAYDTSSLTNLAFSGSRAVDGAGSLTFNNADGSAAGANPGGQALTINGEGYALLYGMADVAAMPGGGRSALARPLDASGTIRTDAVVAASQAYGQFTGTFTGLGNTIAGLAIAGAASGNYGLFGTVGTGGTVRDIGLPGAVVTGGDDAAVGALAGRNNGAVAYAFSTGTVSTGNNPLGAGAYAGGLVGLNRADGAGGSATITNAFSTAAASGGFIASVGGLAGASAATRGGSVSIANAFATGAASGRANAAVGGLVGQLAVGQDGGRATLINAFSTGAAIGGENASVGGLVGDFIVFEGTGAVREVFSTGAAAGGAGATVGGLIGTVVLGFPPTSLSVSNAFSTGAVSGGAGALLGGLVGLGTNVTNSFWDTQTAGIATTSGGGSGLTTADLQGAAPLGALNAATPGAFAGGAGGLYPYLRSFFPGGVQAVTGMAYSDVAGTTPLASGTAGAVPVTVLSGSRSLATATTGANGYWYAFMPAGTLTAGAGLVGHTTPNAATAATNAATAVEATAGTVQTGVDLTGDTYRQRTSATTLSFAPGQAEAAAFADFASVVRDAGLRLVNASGASFTIDTAVTRAGLFQALASGPLTVAAPISAAGGVNLLGRGITLAPGGTVSGGSPTLNSTGAFTNNAGPGAVTATDAGGRWRIYSASPADNTYGGLDSGNTAVWNTGVGGAVAQRGNRYVFAFQPTLTVTTTDVSKTYGQTASLGGAYAITGYQRGVAGAFLGDTEATAVTGAPAVTSAGAARDAAVAGGPYAVTATNGTLGSPAGYDFRFIGAGLLTVERAALTYVADPASRAYGNANPALTGIVTGFVNDETLTGATTGSLLFSSAAGASSNVGSYAVAGSGLAAANYRFVQAAENATALAVTPRPVTVAGSRAYDGTALFSAGQLSVSGGVVGEALSLTAGTGSAGGTDAGTYAGSGLSGLALAVSGGNARASNYALPATGTLTIGRAGLTVLADDASRAYGDPNPSFTASITGFAPGETAAVLGGALSVATDATASSGVGPYAITPSGLTSGNYAITFRPGMLTVTPRPITVTADAQGRDYGDANPALTYALGGGGLVNGDALSGALTTTAGPGSGVGHYAITQGSLAAGPNYALSFASAELTVAPRPVTVTADAQTRVYGDANPALTYAVGGRGLVNGDTLAGLLATTATSRSGVGDYGITQGTLTASPDYALSFQGASLSVTPRPVTVTADALSRSFGGANPDLTFAIGGRGLANGDTLSGALVTAVGATSPVGTYGIAQGSLTASLNYALTFVPGTLSVTPAPLVVQANDAARLYGEANPALTARITGLVAGDTPAALSGSLTVTTVATAASGVGAYAVTPSGLASPNYAPTFLPGTLTVGPAPLTVTVDDVSRLYGRANPAFGVTGTGFVHGDTAAVLAGIARFDTAASEQSPVGPWAVTASGLTAANYALAFRPGILTVVAAPLTLRADDAARRAGQPNPRFTFSLSGLVAGDSPSVVTDVALSTPAGAASAPGLYPIFVEGGRAANYAIIRLPGTLSIEPSAPSVDPDSVGLSRSNIRPPGLPYPFGPASPLGGFGSPVGGAGPPPGALAFGSFFEPDLPTRDLVSPGPATVPN